MSRFFIDRPNFAWVIALFICLAGGLALSEMAVEKFPQAAPPQIRIKAEYPGASVETLNESVVSLIEEELSGAKGLLYFESVSAVNGTAEMSITFAPGTNPDLAQVDVQNRLKKAESRLPDAVVDKGIEVEQANSGFLMIYALRYKEGGASKDSQRLPIWRPATSTMNSAGWTASASCGSSPPKAPCASGWTRKNCSNTACPSTR